MKRILLIGWGVLLAGFLVLVFYIGGRSAPQLAVPQNSQALIDNALSLGCTSGDFPSISYTNYTVPSDCSGSGRGFCQNDQPAGRIFAKGLYSWTIPDDICGNTGQPMKPGCNNPATGEFYGLFQYLEDQIEALIGSPAIIEMLNGQLCGQGTHAATQTTVVITVCGKADICIFDVGHGGWSGSTNYPCYGGTITYTDQYGNQRTWTTQGDGWIIYANKGVAKLWFNPTENAIEALIGIWGDSQAPRIPPLPPVGVGYDQNEPGRVDASPGNRNPDRVCVEAQTRVWDSGMNINQFANLYADALIIKTRLKIVPNPSNPNLIDLCPAFNPSTGGPDPNYTWLELVDADIEPDFNVSACASLIKCNCDADQFFDPAQLNQMLAGTVFDFLNELLHGNCPGATNYCNRPVQPPQTYCDGTDSSYYPCDDNYGNNRENLKLEGNPCDWCDLPAEQMDNPNGGSTSGWNWCVRGVPPPSGTGGGCKPGLLPIDLNNLLGGLFGDLPLSINNPEYSTTDPNYGTLSLFGVKYDLGCYMENVGIKSYGCYPQIGAALYPRWSEYNLCADVAEVGQYPNKTEPPPVQFIAPTSISGGPYHFALGISQDLLTEIAYSLYVSSLACNVFDENSELICGGGLLGGGSNGECTAMKVSTHGSQFPALRTADYDGYIEVRMRPAGSPSVRTGARNYQAEWPSGYPVSTTSGQYDAAMFVPHFLYEVRAPLDDGIPGVATNPKTTFMVFDTNGWAGIDIEWINEIHPLYPYDVGYVRIFLDIKFYLNDIRFSVESGIPPEEQRNSVSNLLGLIGNAYLALLLDTRIQLPMLSPSGENPLTIKFLTGHVRPAMVGSEEPSETVDYLPGVWPENVTGDYWMIYGILQGNIDPFKLMGLIENLGILSPPDEREYAEFMKRYPDTFISLDGWDGDGALPVKITLNPMETKEWMKDGVLRVNVMGYDDETPSSQLRFTTRLNNGIWTVPKGTTAVQVADLPDGHYKLEVAAIDHHQRIDPTPAVIEFTIDNVPPRIVPIEEKTIIYDDKYRLKLYIDDDLTPREKLKARFRIDDGDFVNFDPVKGEVIANFPTVGLHQIYVEVYDEAGNRTVYNPGVFRNQPNKGLSCATVVKSIVDGGYKEVLNVLTALLLTLAIPILVLVILRLKAR